MEVQFSEDTLLWVGIFEKYGWILLLPVLEHIFSSRPQRLFRPGFISDIIHTYHPFNLHPYIAAVVVILFFPEMGNGPLQGSMADMHWLPVVVIIFLMEEVCFYIAHFCAHKIPFLWQFHRVHHSSVELDALSLHRFHIIDKALFNAPVIILLVYLQPDPVILLFLGFVRGFMDRFGHSNIRYPWLPFYFFINPRFHRWHHSNDPAARDKNFARGFPPLDFLLGTAYNPKDKLSQPYGDPEFSNNILIQHWTPLVDLYTMYKEKGLRSFIRFDEQHAENKQESGVTAGRDAN